MITERFSGETQISTRMINDATGTAFDRLHKGLQQFIDPPHCRSPGRQDCSSRCSQQKSGQIPQKGTSQRLPEAGCPHQLKKPLNYSDRRYQQ